MSKRFHSTVVTLLILAFGATGGQARTVRVFAVGNSFSQNATRFLPQLAEAGGHELVLWTAQTGALGIWNAMGRVYPPFSHRRAR